MDNKEREEIILKYLPMMNNIARKRVYNEQDREDLVQELSLKLLNCIDKFDDTKGVFENYFMRTCTNFTNDFVSKICRDISYNLELLEDYDYEDNEEQHYIEDNEDIYESSIVKLFDDNYSKHEFGYLANLRYIHGYNLNELAQEFDISKRTVERRLNKFNEWFKEILDTNGYKVSHE